MKNSGNWLVWSLSISKLIEETVLLFSFLLFILVGRRLVLWWVQVNGLVWQLMRSVAQASYWVSYGEGRISTEEDEWSLMLLWIGRTGPLNMFEFVLGSAIFYTSSFFLLLTCDSVKCYKQLYKTVKTLTFSLSFSHQEFVLAHTPF